MKRVAKIISPLGCRDTPARIGKIIFMVKLAGNILGDQIALTPPMRWNSWNCGAESVDQKKGLRPAQALVASGLINV